MASVKQVTFLLKVAILKHGHSMEMKTTHNDDKPHHFELQDPILNCLRTVCCAHSLHNKI